MRRIPLQSLARVNRFAVYLAEFASQTPGACVKGPRRGFQTTVLFTADTDVHRLTLMVFFFICGILFISVICGSVGTEAEGYRPGLIKQ
jgi:hypothetical protein